MPDKPSSASCGVGFVCDIRGTRSHAVVSMGIEAVKNLTHRGAIGADGKTGDGAGVMLQMPWSFFQREQERLGLAKIAPADLAVGVFFLYREVETGVEEALGGFGLKTGGWRDVPVDRNALGETARQSMPRIRHLLIDTAGIALERKETVLYLARRAIEKRFGGALYVCSLSSRTIVYKGMLVAHHLDEFYPDLRNDEVDSAFCIFHQRFSTNTSPDWTLAQ